jgi:Protein of unknown function (DUF2637)
MTALRMIFSRTTLRRLLALVVVVVAAVWSFDALTNLAQHVGFGQLSWMFPLCIDAVAAIGMDYWMTRSPAWKAGRAMAMCAITVSTAGNVVDWVLRDVHELAVIFGAVPPAALAWVLGIMHRNARGMEELAAWLAAEQRWKDDQHAQAELERTEREARRLERAERKRPRVKAERLDTPKRAVEPSNVTELSPAKRGDDALVSQLAEIVRTAGDVPPKREIMARFNVGSDRALRLRSLVATETREIETDEGVS